MSGACVRQMTAVNGNISPLMCIHAVFTASPCAACLPGACFYDKHV